MSYCKNCNREIQPGSNFCGSCGFINLRGNGDILNDAITLFKYIFLNPVSFIRTSKVVNTTLTGTILGTIAIMELLFVLLTGKASSVPKAFASTFLITLVIILLEASFLFVLSKLIIKRASSFLHTLNLVIYSEFIFLILSVICYISASILPEYIVICLFVFVRIICTLLMYQGFKELVPADLAASAISFCLSISCTLLIYSIIATEVFKASLRDLL